MRDAAIAAEGRGVLVLLRDLTMKLAVGEASPQTLRQYGLGAQILLNGFKSFVDPTDLVIAEG
jgi:GTP cyclohydrolase II